MKRKHFFRRGVTLTELAIAVAILFGTFMLGKIMIDIANNISGQKLAMDGQREAQIALYAISKDIRNARNIVQVSSDTSNLVLRVFDTSLGYDVANNPDLFTPNHLGSITWAFENSNGQTYLTRTSQVNSAPCVKKYCRNILRHPDEKYPLFLAVLTEGTTTAVDINLGVFTRKGDQANARFYGTSVQTRGLTQ